MCLQTSLHFTHPSVLMTYAVIGDRHTSKHTFTLGLLLVFIQVYRVRLCCSVCMHLKGADKLFCMFSPLTTNYLHLRLTADHFPSIYMYSSFQNDCLTLKKATGFSSFKYSKKGREMQQRSHSRTHIRDAAGHGQYPLSFVVVIIQHLRLLSGFDRVPMPFSVVKCCQGFVYFTIQCSDGHNLVQN